MSAALEERVFAKPQGIRLPIGAVPTISFETVIASLESYPISGTCEAFAACLAEALEDLHAKRAISNEPLTMPPWDQRRAEARIQAQVGMTGATGKAGTLFCNEPGHYRDALRTDLIVGAPNRPRNTNH